MAKISLRTLLSEMREAERKCLETVRHHLQGPDAREAELSRRRLSLYDEFLGSLKQDMLVEDDGLIEGVYKKTIEKIAQENGSVSDHHLDHVFIHDEDIEAYTKRTRA